MHVHTNMYNSKNSFKSDEFSIKTYFNLKCIVFINYSTKVQCVYIFKIGIKLMSRTFHLIPRELAVIKKLACYFE